MVQVGYDEEIFLGVFTIMLTTVEINFKIVYMRHNWQKINCVRAKVDNRKLIIFDCQGKRQIPLLLLISI